MFQKAIEIALSKDEDIVSLVKIANGNPKTFLVGADLRYFDLRNGNLSEFNLSRTDFLCTLINERTVFSTLSNLSVDIITRVMVPQRGFLPSLKALREDFLSIVSELKSVPEEFRSYDFDSSIVRIKMFANLGISASHDLLAVARNLENSGDLFISKFDGCEISYDELDRDIRRIYHGGIKSSVDEDLKSIDRYVRTIVEILDSSDAISFSRSVYEKIKQLTKFRYRKVDDIQREIQITHFDVSGDTLRSMVGDKRLFSIMCRKSGSVFIKDRGA